MKQIKNKRIDTVIFEEQFERIKDMTGVTTQVELANFLGIQQSSISDARRRKNIPLSWLIRLLRIKDINPDWILLGKGEKYRPCIVCCDEQEVKDNNTLVCKEDIFINSQLKKKDMELQMIPIQILMGEFMKRIGNVCSLLLDEDSY